MVLSTTTWRFFKDEPSLISRNDSPLESRRVRTQPFTKIWSIAAGLRKASLTHVRRIRLASCHTSQQLRGVSHVSCKTIHQEPGESQVAPRPTPIVTYRFSATISPSPRVGNV